MTQPIEHAMSQEDAEHAGERAHATRKRPREESPEPSAGGEALGPLRLDMQIRQGLAEDLTSLRANDRTARFNMDIHSQSERESAQVARIMRGEHSGPGWVRFDFALLYDDGTPVQMQLQNRHSDHIDVMEPSGANHTRRKISDSVFCIDSRDKAKRGPGTARSFTSSVHLEISEYPRCVSSELKFSTNITSRQHDRQNFIWRVTLTASFDGENTVRSSSSTSSFEYVARRLKTQPAPRKKKAASESRKKHDMSIDGDDSESDMESHQVVAPRSRRSTRKAAVACQQSLSQYVMSDDGEFNPPEESLVGRQVQEEARVEAPRSGPMAVDVLSGNTTRPSVQFPLPNQFRVTIPVHTAAAGVDEEILRNPSAGGRNLCRVESIDNLEWRDEQRRASEFLSRCSEEELAAFQSEEPGHTESAPELMLSRCISSDYFTQNMKAISPEASDDSEGPVHVPVTTLTAV